MLVYIFQSRTIILSLVPVLTLRLSFQRMISIMSGDIYYVFTGYNYSQHYLLTN